MSILDADGRSVVGIAVQENGTFSATSAFVSLTLTGVLPMSAVPVGASIALGNQFTMYAVSASEFTFSSTIGYSGTVTIDPTTNVFSLQVSNGQRSPLSFNQSLGSSNPNDVVKPMITKSCKDAEEAYLASTGMMTASIFLAVFTAFNPLSDAFMVGEIVSNFLSYRSMQADCVG